jgi:ketosteroid isomerase-like protein
MQQTRLKKMHGRAQMADTEMTPELIAFVKEQKDRHDIWQALLRYTRGVDRGDKALMASAYHPDALDEHGVAQGTPDQFTDWAIGWHAENQIQHQHIIVNHSVHLDGDTAHGETYYIFWGENRAGPPNLAFGRYVDRFEKRDGRWAIAHRVCVNQISGGFTTFDIPQEYLEAMRSTGPNTRDSNDISYDRPLMGSRGYVPVG